MLKQLTIAAFAVTAVSAFGQDGTMMDAKSMKPKELLKFLQTDTYKKVSAPDAYIINEFLMELPGNYTTVLARSLVANAEEAKSIAMENQTTANGMAPMGDMTPPMEKSSFSNFQSKDRSFKDVTMDPMARVAYTDTVAILQKDNDQVDQGLIDSLFHAVSFTKSLVPTYTNERQLDAIERYIKANAMSTKPVRLKYTSLATHMYSGLPSDWSSKPWPAGS